MTTFAEQDGGQAQEAGTAESEGQEPEAQEQDPQGQEPAGEEGQQTFDAEYVKKLRAEAAAQRTRAAEAESKVKQFEDRDKSELQLAQEKAAEAERRAADAELEAKVADLTRHAEKQGAYDGRIVADLLPAEYTDLDAEMSKLKTERPFLFQQTDEEIAEAAKKGARGGGATNSVRQRQGKAKNISDMSLGEVLKFKRENPDAYYSQVYGQEQQQ